MTATRVTIASSTIVKAFIWFLIFASLIYMSDLIITLLVAVVLASAIEPVVNVLGKYRVPRSVSVLIILLSIVGIIAAVAFIFIPPLADDIAKFVRSLPSILESIQVFGIDLGFSDLAGYVSELSQNISRGQILSVIKSTLLGDSGFFATTSHVVNAIFNGLVTFVIAFYLALEENGVQKFLKLLSPLSYENYIVDLWSRSQKKISQWAQGQFLLSVIIGVLVYIPLLFLDMPYATLLALLAFLGEFIPVIGFALAAIPALIIAFVFGGLQYLGIISIVYFIIAQLENYFIYPKIMNRATGVPSVIVIIAMLIGFKLAGFWGLILAVPMASIFIELVSDYDKRKRAVIAG